MVKEKIYSEDKTFMTRQDIHECIMTLKSKNSEGFDRIPQRILIDGVHLLLSPLTRLFDLIYTNCKIPEQWKVARTIPVYKNKGKTNQI